MGRILSRVAEEHHDGIEELEFMEVSLEFLPARLLPPCHPRRMQRLVTYGDAARRAIPGPGDRQAGQAQGLQVLRDRALGGGSIDPGILPVDPAKSIENPRGVHLVHE